MIIALAPGVHLICPFNGVSHVYKGVAQVEILVFNFIEKSAGAASRAQRGRISPDCRRAIALARVGAAGVLENG